MLALVASSLCGCRKDQPGVPPPKPATLSQGERPSKDVPSPAATPPPTAATPGAEAATTQAPTHPKPGWSELSLRDTLPICVFANSWAREKTLFIRDVKKQTLRANSTVVFGVFGPWCLNDQCDELPMLQCSVERVGSDLIVHTRYFSFHKDGSSCTEGCLEVDSSCETPELTPGKYTVRHGDKTYELQIPSVLRRPCLNADVKH
jgi:hypothetical protein